MCSAYKPHPSPVTHVQPIPELEQFLVSNVQPTGVQIGRGSYGSVEEVRMPGALYAAKRLHEELLTFGSAQQVLIVSVFK